MLPLAAAAQVRKAVACAARAGEGGGPARGPVCQAAEGAAAAAAAEVQHMQLGALQVHQVCGVLWEPPGTQQGPAQQTEEQDGKRARLGRGWLLARGCDQDLGEVESMLLAIWDPKQSRAEGLGLASLPLLRH